MDEQKYIVLEVRSTGRIRKGTSRSWDPGPADGPATAAMNVESFSLGDAAEARRLFEAARRRLEAERDAVEQRRRELAEKSDALDVFYVTDPSGAKLAAPAMRAAEAALSARL